MRQCGQDSARWERVPARDGSSKIAQVRQHETGERDGMGKVMQARKGGGECMGESVCEREREKVRVGDRETSKEEQHRTGSQNCVCNRNSEFRIKKFCQMSPNNFYLDFIHFVTLYHTLSCDTR